jgi:hypothetical protein
MLKSGKKYSKDFAEYLFLSNIADEFKKELLKVLPQMSPKHIRNIYKALKKENSMQKRMILKFNVELNKKK